MAPDSFPIPLPHRQTPAESTAQTLLTQIEPGRWTESLPGERDLCEALQISRPTLRQALKVLEREGRVEVSQGRRRRALRRSWAHAPVCPFSRLRPLNPPRAESTPGDSGRKPADPD
ncbi:MAG TPA: winged helix-turn-helix domain-containing protein [Verrucomicrobiota bacterium]|nr:winged helix-turn-helix domain-containing protein [Verrucomicrobiota bacterium]HNU50754.1 winged helix-turn-helix domain-containing protein [Verrucomicrobiota bacterium]